MVLKIAQKTQNQANYDEVTTHCFEVVVVVIVVVVVVDVVFVVVVVINVDVVVQATSKVDLRLLVMEVEFGWVVGGQWWWGAKIVLG